MKDIQIFVLHPAVQSVEQMIRHFCLETLDKKYNFIWNEQSPDYLIVTEHIYVNYVWMKKFLKLYKRTNLVTIFWAGECITPDMNLFDYAVCFDRDMKLGDRIVQMPPCRRFFESFVTEDISNCSFDDAKQFLENKTDFCNFIYSNPYAHPMRDRLFHKISGYKRVDSLGKHLNNVGRKGTGYVGHAKETTELKRKYKFSIACENAVFDGYTSEKILTSFQAHTIPIYYGNPHIDEDFNSKAFVNVSDFATLDDLLEEIKRLDESDELWCQKVCEPWQTEEQIHKDELRMQAYVQFFENIFNTDTGGGHKAPVGTWKDKYQDYFFMGIRANNSIIGRCLRKIKRRIKYNGRKG